jgi:sulfite exporter TauE/SafE
MSLFSGIIFGLAPCPPLIGLLGLAVLSKSGITGAAMGLVFGISTIISPILFLGLFSGWFAKHEEFKQYIPYASGIFLIVIGLIYLFQ